MYNIWFFIDDSSLTIVFTGTVGVGKSEAGNFFAGKKIFDSDIDFGGVTTVSAAKTIQIDETNLQIIDTPGFMDAVNAELIDSQEIAHAIVLAREGVHAFGLVMKGNGRFDKASALALKELEVSFSEILPYIFVIFTHSAALGQQESTQKKKLEKMLANPKCPKQMNDFLQAINNRYMLLESVDYDRDSNYHNKKRKELLSHISEIQKERQSKPLTLNIMCFAKELYEKERKESGSGTQNSKENAYSGTVQKVHTAIAEASQSNKKYAKEGQMRIFWKNTAKAALVILGCTIGTAIGEPIGEIHIGGQIGYAAGTIIVDLVCSIQ